MKKFFITFLLVLALLIGGLSAFLYQQVMGNYADKDLELKIHSGSSYAMLLNQLEEANFIKNEAIFNLLADKMNLKNNVRSGYYIIPKNTSLLESIRILRGGLQTPINVTFNNVNFKEDLAAKIASQLEIDSTQIMQFLTDDSAVSALSYNLDNILCLFIPNTYEMYWNISFPQFIKRMVSEHNSFWSTARKAKADKLNLSENEVYILASIVEKEYKHAEERSKIAGVYINRLTKGMKLQADPTVKFAIGDLTIKRVLTVHTEYDNPYNTYYYTDLPPGPICLPETSTIDAVLNAEDHDYIYFCAKADLSGYHSFNTSYNAHLRAAKLYQAALNKLKIYE